MAYARHQALVASTVATFNPTNNTSIIEVINRSGTAEVFVTADGSTPSVNGNDCDIVPAIAGASTVIRRPVAADVVIKAISSGTPTISVRAVG